MYETVGNIEVFIQKIASSYGSDNVEVILFSLNRPNRNYEVVSSDTINPRHKAKFHNIPLGHYKMEVSCKGYRKETDFVHVKFPGEDTQWKGNFRKSRNIKYIDISKQFLFPFAKYQNGTVNSIQSYRTGPGAFGADRSSGKRRHAGCDLYAPKGTPVRAMQDGLVIQEYPFYMNTRALEIDHGDLLLRYCEISNIASGIKRGGRVKRGQVIAFVGELTFPDGNVMSMLHLECYKGTLNGPLTVRDAMPFQRRGDLLDPTRLLDDATID